MPWRISTGAVLYRDLFYIGGGPFSQYFNALLFKFFGASFLTLTTANLIFVGATIVLVYRRFLAAANMFVATAICLGIVLVFAFNEYTLTGNYNYISPYSHEALHGLLLSILTVALLSDWLAKTRLRYAVAAGFCSGLVFLTKPDIFFALAVCIAAAFVLFVLTSERGSMTRSEHDVSSLWRLTEPRSNAAKSAAAFLGAALLPLLFFFFLFLRVEDWHTSLRSVLGGWLPLFQPGVINNPFYRWCLGLDEPGFRFEQIIIQSIGIVLIIAIYALALKHQKNLETRLKLSPGIIYLLLISPLILGAACFDWRSCGAALPLLNLCACVLIYREYRKRSAQPASAFPFLWSIFSLVLLSKMGLFPRIVHYGFTLGMPAFVSALYLLLWLLPNLLEARFAVPRRQFCIALGVPLFIGFGSLFYQSQLVYAGKNVAVGTSADKIFAFSSPGTNISTALEWTSKNIPSDSTLAVLPEGVMLNFLTRHPNPTPCLSWEPVIMHALGPVKMTAAFEQNPPDYIYLVERDSSEFGVGYFGSPGFGDDLMQWVRTNYQPVQLFGDEPLKNGKFGVEILKRQPDRTKQN
ncbi:MAG TPA: hypothetical protein VGI03_09645 [Verrucomicrobiae bacterium]|jgi:hypothetical protein